MMNRTARIFLTLATLLTAVLACSCERRGLIIPEEPQLYVRVSLPDAVLTRAETGTHNGTAAERAVNSLQIWVFRAGIGILKRGKPKSIKLSCKSIVYKYIN